MSKTTTYWLGILGVVFFAIPAVIGGLQFEEYSPISQFISETYATGTPYGNLLRFLGYVPSGILFFLFGISAPKFLPKSKLIKIAFWLFAIFYGIGTIVVSIFPCDEGCNRELINPSISQLIHNLAGGLMYLIVPFTLIAIGIAARSWNQNSNYSVITLICGAIALVFVWLMLSSPNGNYVGLFQRTVEVSILIWVVKTALLIRNKGTVID